MHLAYTTLLSEFFMIHYIHPPNGNKLRMERYRSVGVSASFATSFIPEERRGSLTGNRLGVNCSNLNHRSGMIWFTEHFMCLHLPLIPLPPAV